MEKDKILIADDSKLNRELLSAIIGEKYDYIYAENGLEVMAAIERKETIDIILLDINMPKMSGFEVLQVLHDNHFIEEVPVVVISSENDAEFVQKAYELGATDYINRPFNSIVVQHRIKNTLMLYSNQKRLVRLVESQIYEREKTSNAMINIFSNIIELRNHESGSHTLHVQSITNLLLHELVKITDKYDLNEESISLISSLSALHDIGKIKVPESILNKPGKLTDEEWRIMKNHTIEGYNILCHANIEQDNKFMNTAKEICRWHHEKYDGKGYPDGLVKDNIPISAQVVSIADVYDALTSERCYKKAFTHKEAINMILNGECGEFNPLLIECLKNVSDKLKDALNIGLYQYDYYKESTHMINEILSNNDLPLVKNTHVIAEFEKEKREFFEDEAAQGIQFEYDMEQHKLRYLNNYEDGSERRKTLFTSINNLRLLSDNDWNEFKKRIQNTTRNNRIVSMNVLIPINGMYRWHRLIAKTIWPENGDKYSVVLGQFSDINDEIVNKGMNCLFNEKKAIGLIYSLNEIFPVVRIVDPKTSKIIKVDENGNLIKAKGNCYQIWDKNKKCDNCTSLEALSHKNWLSKLEVKEGQVYAVLSKYVKIKKDDYILEIAFNVADDLIKSKNRSKMISSHLFLDFYHDSLTKCYTRTYLEDFSESIEKADGVAILDADGFKKINDTYGHQVGDIALAKIAEVVQKVIEDKNIAIRYGGDEFLIVFPKIKKDEFNNMLDNIKEEVRKIRIDNYEAIHLSVSIGGAYKVHPLNEAINLADKMMYQCKAKN